MGGTKIRQFSAASASHHMRSSGKFSNTFCMVEESSFCCAAAAAVAARLAILPNVASRALSINLVPAHVLRCILNLEERKRQAGRPEIYMSIN